MMLGEGGESTHFLIHWIILTCKEVWVNEKDLPESMDPGNDRTYNKFLGSWT